MWDCAAVEVGVWILCTCPAHAIRCDIKWQLRIHMSGGRSGLTASMSNSKTSCTARTNYGAPRYGLHMHSVLCATACTLCIQPTRCCVCGVGRRLRFAYPMAAPYCTLVRYEQGEKQHMIQVTQVRGHTAITARISCKPRCDQCCSKGQSTHVSLRHVRWLTLCRACVAFKLTCSKCFAVYLTHTKQTLGRSAEWRTQLLACT